MVILFIARSKSSLSVATPQLFGGVEFGMKWNDVDGGCVAEDEAGIEMPVCVKFGATKKIVWIDFFDDIQAVSRSFRQFEAFIFNQPSQSQ